MSGLSRTQLRAELLSAREVAEYLDVEPNTVRSYLARGLIVAPLVTLGSGPVWLRADVAQWDRARPRVARQRANAAS